MTANGCRLSWLRGACRGMLDEFGEAHLRRQSHPELSPLLWHVGHVFATETYWLQERVFGRRAIDAERRALYFPEHCAKKQRSARLPALADVRAWTHRLAAQNDVYWQQSTAHAHPLLAQGYLRAFIRQHYAQHLETMQLAAAQLRGAERGPRRANLKTTAAPPRPDSTRVRMVAAHRAHIGTATIDAHDNEQPTRHVAVAPFAIAKRPVTNAQWLRFMDAGGYHDAALWDAPGWAWRAHRDVGAPQHWRPGAAGGWYVPADTAGPIDTQPVHGIGWYEARAFARYARARLPRELEWEAARRADVLAGCHRVWEWCDDAFRPYPGFEAFPYDGYSRPWFDGAHFVARGGSYHTQAEIRRPGFRNFYPPTHRHVFAGLRLAW